MKRYIYKNKKTNRKVESDSKLSDPELKLIREIRDGRMKSIEVITK